MHATRVKPKHCSVQAMSQRKLTVHAARKPPALTVATNSALSSRQFPENTPAKVTKRVCKARMVFTAPRLELLFPVRKNVDSFEAPFHSGSHRNMPALTTWRLWNALPVPTVWKKVAPNSHELTPKNNPTKQNGHSSQCCANCLRSKFFFISCYISRWTLLELIGEETEFQGA